jgi:hypothetical protein
MIIKVKFIFIFHFSCRACFLIYFLHPTLPPYTFCTQQLQSCRLAHSHVSFFMSNMFRDIHFAPNTYVIYILHPTILSYTYTFLNVNLEFWNFDFVYDNKGEIYFNFSFFMSSLFVIYFLHPTLPPYIFCTQQV